MSYDDCRSPLHAVQADRFYIRLPENARTIVTGPA